MNERSALDFCERWLPAWTGNAPERLITYYADDAFYRDPTVKQGLRGHGEILPYFAKLLGNNPRWLWTAEEVFPTPGGFTLKWKARIPVHGEVLIEYGLDIVEIENGVILRNEVFFDTRELIRAITRK